ncbi:MAG: AAA family ATPase [Pseudomonadota bacterium]
MTEDPSIILIEALQNPACYPHPVTAVRRVETHISWVLLTGDYAYKIKKPVAFGFLDFSSLAQRRHCCEEELRLNRRLAPELYLAVLPITGTPAAPRLGGVGEAIEYAVQMREFPQEAQLDRVLARGELGAARIAALAETLAAFHSTAVVAKAGGHYGSAEAVWQPVAQNFAQIRPRLAVRDELDQLDALQHWSETAFASLRGVFTQRQQTGHIRECHGDAHLGNIALLDGRPVLFDCIEFNPELRWIDVMSEIAFLTMDLHDRGRPDLARRVLNDYLQYTGDYAGLRVLRFYQVYRALVRAKVACLRLAQDGLSEDQRRATQQQVGAYLRLAARFTAAVPTPLMITHGLSGSGKTTLSDGVLESQGAIRLRSDVERKRLFGLAADARGGSAVNDGLYSAEAGTRTYQHLAELAETVLGAGFPVIIDAAFLKRGQREMFHQLAERMHLPFVIFDCKAPSEQLRGRIAERATAGRDASEATISVLEQQLEHGEPVSCDEALLIFTIQTGAAPQ